MDEALLRRLRDDIWGTYRKIIKNSNEVTKILVASRQILEKFLGIIVLYRKEYKEMGIDVQILDDFKNLTEAQLQKISQYLDGNLDGNKIITTEQAKKIGSEILNDVFNAESNFGNLIHKYSQNREIINGRKVLSLKER